MSSYLDIISSIVLGSMVLLMILSFNNDMVEQNGINNMYVWTQKNGMDFQEIINHDFKKIGLNVPDTTSVFSIADSIQIKFKSDYDQDGTINDIHYYIGNTSTADFTENPNDRMLYRRIDANPAENYTFGLVDFSFTFYDEDGNQTTNLNNIMQIEYQFYLESTFSYDGEYPGMFIRGKTKPKNLE